MVKHHETHLLNTHMAVCQNLVPLVNIKIAGKWMFIPLKIVLIGIDPYPYLGIPWATINHRCPATCRCSSLMPLSVLWARFASHHSLGSLGKHRQNQRKPWILYGFFQRKPWFFYVDLVFTLHSPCITLSITLSMFNMLNLKHSWKILEPMEVSSLETHLSDNISVAN